MSQELEKRILKIFQQSEKAISTDTLTFLTNSHPRDVCEKLKILEKYGMIKPVTERKVRFFKIR
jgi:acetolactate synthase small subunit